MGSVSEIENPELFFCLVGPIGTNIELVSELLVRQLNEYKYDAEIIHLTSLIPTILGEENYKPKSEEDRYDYLIKKSNHFRKITEDDSIMARLALVMIQDIRNKRSGDATKRNKPVAYIIRQFKRAEEIKLFREIYGKQAFQISAYADPELRSRSLAQKMRDANPSRTRVGDFSSQANELIKRDEAEEKIPHGQRIRDVFPLADIFIDASSTETIRSNLERFIKILFGFNFHSPTKEEYGMYMAKSASLRSLDLSRQVGAAIFTKEGEVKTLGCNEVPSPRGGTYWEDDKDDKREFEIGRDTNEDFKHRLLADTLEQLASVNLIPEEYAKMSSHEFLSKILKDTNVDLEKQMMLMDIIEYGRIIHAEMNAITDAARNGISLNNTTLFCTTFPCHLCAKHIISSGINRVVYIEPYPKSYAYELYRDDIILKRSETEKPDKVHFEPFMGIAPFRYRDLFEKSKRKNSNGTKKDWQADRPSPIIKGTGTEYISTELEHLKILIAKMADIKAMLHERPTEDTSPTT